MNSVNDALVEFSIRAQPEHLHLFVCGPDDFKLGQWIGMLKQHLASVIEWTETSRPIWQRGFFDHLLRSAESYGQKWNYVRENPVRAGLVEKAEIGLTRARSSLSIGFNL